MKSSSSSTDSSSDHKPVLSNAKDWLKVILSGMCMGAADIVPGISGGTVAFIMGFYDNLLRSISSFNLNSLSLFFRFRFKEFFHSVGWEFLLALVTGISISFITLASTFHYILGHEVYRVFLYAGFFGLIIASIYYCAKHVKKWSLDNISGLVCGTLVGFALTGATLEFSTNEPLYHVPIHVEKFPHPIENFDGAYLLNVPESDLPAMLAKQAISKDTVITNQNTYASGPVSQFISLNHRYGLSGWMILCGAIAVTAMLLPGISGSYMLTILGAYAIAIGALADFITGLKSGVFYWDDFFTLVSMLIGILIGALVFSRVVHWLMLHYRSLTVATMIGFMVGALPSVWPYYSYEYRINPLKVDKGPLLWAVEPILPDLSSKMFWYSLIFCVAGFLLVIFVEILANVKSSSQETKS